MYFQDLISKLQTVEGIANEKVSFLNPIKAN